MEIHEGVLNVVRWRQPKDCAGGEFPGAQKGCAGRVRCVCACARRDPVWLCLRTGPGDQDSGEGGGRELGRQEVGYLLEEREAPRPIWVALKGLR